jgi:hypothetical protein
MSHKARDYSTQQFVCHSHNVEWAKLDRGQLAVLADVFLDGHGGRKVSKKYVVRLSKEERKQLVAMVHSQRATAHQVFWARVLLKTDQGEDGPGLTDAEVAETLETTARTVERLRRRILDEGLQAALTRKRRLTQTRPPVLDASSEARLLAVCCSEPPVGHRRWSVRLLAKRLMQLGVVESVSRETVRRTLRKRNTSNLLNSKGGSSSRTTLGSK